MMTVDDIKKKKSYTELVPKMSNVLTMYAV